MGLEARMSSYDILIIGAGLSGICSLYHLRERFPTWRIKILEAGNGVGGTWFWNRYPGCRFDSESISYGYSFDPELLQEWHWKESFSPQPETLRYMQRVCNKHDIIKDVHFNVRVKAATWLDDTREWSIVDENGNVYSTRFLVSCMGFLSSPTLPNIPGIEDFAGLAFHTSRWPAGLDLSTEFVRKRVGVIGTGATGIQTITALSKGQGIKSLKVFQRTANWSAPLRNTDITVEQMAEHKSNYDEIFRRCAATPSCFLHEADPRKTFDVNGEERTMLYEKLYASPGFAKWLGAFSDTYTDPKANKLYSDFMAQKIRERVHDPEVAEALIPKNHGFGTRRVPLESGYFEAFNQPNVHLIDLQKTPITKVTKDGIETADGCQHKLDVLIFATGFDAVTGAFSAIEWQAKGGRPLINSEQSGRDKEAIWAGMRPETFLGLMAPAMPNFFMVLGPHQPFGNATRSIEHAVKVITDLLQFCKDHQYTYVEPRKVAAKKWTEHVIEVGSVGLLNEVDSWMTGVNTNVKGKQVRTVARYAGSAIEFRRRCEECKEAGWNALILA